MKQLGKTVVSKLGTVHKLYVTQKSTFSEERFQIRERATRKGNAAIKKFNFTK